MGYWKTDYTFTSDQLAKFQADYNDAALDWDISSDEVVGLLKDLDIQSKTDCVCNVYVCYTDDSFTKVADSKKQAEICASFPPRVVIVDIPDNQKEIFSDFVDMLKISPTIVIKEYTNDGNGKLVAHYISDERGVYDFDSLLPQINLQDLAYKASKYREGVYPGGNGPDHSNPMNSGTPPR